jgi:hypothetical protein
MTKPSARTHRDEGTPDQCASCGHPPTPSRPVLPLLVSDGAVTVTLPWCDPPAEATVPRVAKFQET